MFQTESTYTAHRKEKSISVNLKILFSSRKILCYGKAILYTKNFIWKSVLQIEYSMVETVGNSVWKLVKLADIINADIWQLWFKMLLILWPTCKQTYGRFCIYNMPEGGGIFTAAFQKSFLYWRGDRSKKCLHIHQLNSWKEGFLTPIQQPCYSISLSENPQ